MPSKKKVVTVRHVFLHPTLRHFVASTFPGAIKKTYAINRPALSVAGKRGAKITNAKRAYKNRFKIAAKKGAETRRLRKAAEKTGLRYIGAAEFGFDARIRFIYEIPFTRRRNPLSGKEQPKYEWIPDLAAIQQAIELERDHSMSVECKAKCTFKDDRDGTWFPVSDIWFYGEKNMAIGIASQIYGNINRYVVESVLTIQLQFRERGAIK